MVTTRRCAPLFSVLGAGGTDGWAAGAGDAAASGAPQLPQNLLPGRLVAEHCGHTGASGPPHSVQKRQSASFVAPHAAQIMAAAYSPASPYEVHNGGPASGVTLSRRHASSAAVVRSAASWTTLRVIRRPVTSRRVHNGPTNRSIASSTSTSDATSPRSMARWTMVRSPALR